MMKFTVLMTVYGKERPEFFRESLKSILVEQTVLPDQFVLVYDGPMTNELIAVAEEFRPGFPNEYDIVALPENVGQGAASKAGMEHCKYEFVARMDSDDISYPTRFEKELAAFSADPELDVVGGFISEFKNDPHEITGIRKTAETHEAVVAEFHRRNPMNNVSVMFRKQALEDIGGYSVERANEDFNVYVRFLLGGKKFHNIQEPLVNVRVGNNMVERRGDINIYKAWKKNQRLLYQGKIISWFEYFRNCVGCYGFVRCPKWIKTALYTYVLRSK